MLRRPPRVGLVLSRHMSYRHLVVNEPYDSTLVEVQSGLYEDWHRRGLFSPDTQSSQPFVMCLPPPNVTGDLHIGHALAFTTEDALGRWYRMRGRPTLLIPGTDHAGIATQAVVERALAKKGRSRLEMGREKFTAEVFAWSNEKQRIIRRQVERLGVSADWSRQFFTLDQTRSNAVTEAFRRLHATGKIYRGERIVNYCCALRSVISDIEVDSKAIDGPQDITVPGHKGSVSVGRLHLLAYPLESRGSHEKVEEIIVGTTRIETMLGDTAVAVHPSDARFNGLIGRRLIHPFFPERRLPIVADEQVDPDAGTGAVKVTPGHSAVDFLIGQRHHLDVINLFNDDGSLNASAGKQYEGLSRFAARDAVKRDLEALGLYRGWREHAQLLPMCSRTGDLVEPILRPQWFVRCSGEMAERALDAVTSGALQLRPSNYSALWEEWMSKCQDWCISRQLWWGHRIPAWQSAINGSWRVPHDSEQTRELIESPEWRQDEDVLDTWFSSALLPFSVLGWPNVASRDLTAFYPNTTLETGVDILFFWVARMVMLGQELTGQLPFREVLLHGLVCDRDGQKMSKSKGNVVDPLTIMDGCGKIKIPAIKTLGADALRTALLSFNTKTLHLNFSEQEVLKHRKFANKVWNTLRFIFNNLQLGEHLTEEALAQLDPQDLPLVDRLALKRLGRLVSVCEAAMEERQFHAVVKSVPAFWLDTLSRTFLEVAKPRLWSSADPETSKRTQQVLFLLSDTCLRLLHPVMPFLTDFGWRGLMEFRADPTEGKALTGAAFPQPELFARWAEAVTESEEEEVEAGLEACALANSWRTRLKVSKADMRESVRFQCLDPRRLVVCGPLADALCRFPLQPVLEETPVDRSRYLLLPIQPGLRLLVLRQKAQPGALEELLRRSIEKCRMQADALSKAGADATAYEMTKVNRRIEELNLDLGLLNEAMRT